MRNYIFLCSTVLVVLFSCSEDSNIKTEKEIAIETKKLFELNFLPTLENYFGKDQGTIAYKSSSLAGNWVHEFDDNDKLTKSQFYENHPSRILREIVFSDYDSDLNKVNFQLKIYNYFTLAKYEPLSYTMFFEEDYTLKSFKSMLDNDSTPGIVFEELDENKRIVLMKDGVIDEKIGYEYDGQGRISKYIIYDSGMNVKSTVDYSYNGQGDLKTYNFQNNTGSSSTSENFYRSDNTLERMEQSFDYGLGVPGEILLTFGEDESFLKKVTQYDNGEIEIVIYDGPQITEEYYVSLEKLLEVYIYKLSSNNENYYLEEYKKYDENNNLEYTEYYDEQGNVTETIYE